MKETNLPKILEEAKLLLSNKSSCRIFKLLPDELLEILDLHCSCIEKIDKLNLNNPELENKLTTVKYNLEQNKSAILEKINRLTDRQIIIHITSEEDTIWKLSKKYSSNMYEILEINNIKNIYSLQQGKILLIPRKII